MMGSFLSRALVLVFGYAYPAYECYKTVELNKPDIELLRFWCQYWIIVALFGILEWFADIFIFWLPMYSEAKVAFYIYLWYPKTRGTTLVYETYFKPYMATHETEIDRNLLELRTRTGDMMMLYMQKAVSFGQTWFFEVLQFVASQAPRTRPVQQQQQPDQPQKPKKYQGPSKVLPDHQDPSAEPPVFQTSRKSVFLSKTVIPTQLSTSNSTPTGPGTDGEPRSIEEPEQIDASDSLSTDGSNPTAEETLIEEAIRMTRSNLRKRASNATADSGSAE